MTTPTDRNALAAEIGLPQGEPTPFPDDDAAEVTRWAVEIDAWIIAGDIVVSNFVPGGASFVAIVTDAITIMKAILGDPRRAMDTALAWAEAAAVPLTIKEDLNGRKIVLSSYWSGGAHDAFAGHLDALLAGMDTASAKMTVMAKTIAGSFSHVMDTYEAAVAYLGDCVANLAGLAALPFSLLDAANFAKGFAEAIISLQESSLAIINDYRQDMINLAVDAITFPSLADNPAVLDRVDDTDDWDVRPTG
jgi:hypothetical protein